MVVEASKYLLIDSSFVPLNSSLRWQTVYRCTRLIQAQVLFVVEAKHDDFDERDSEKYNSYTSRLAGCAVLVTLARPVAKEPNGPRFDDASRFRLKARRAVLCQAVDERGGRLGVADDSRPLATGAVGGDNDLVFPT